MASQKRLAMVLVITGLLCAECGGANDKNKSPRDPLLDQKIERLLTLILEVEQRGAGADDSLSQEANALIAELGGEDSAASILAARLLDNADRWVPLLDSLARVSTGGAAAPPPPSAP